MSDQVYLSRLVLNLRSRKVWRAIDDCMEMHRVLMSAFPNGLSSGATARAEAGLLYRMESIADGIIVLLIQSSLPPDWVRLPTLWLDPGA
jgi:hypothetical protein